MPLLPRLLKTFYRTGLGCLPVVAPPGPRSAGPRSSSKPAASGSDTGAPVDEFELLGFALRSELDQFMADLDRARGEFDEIPPEILIRDRVPSQAISGLQNRAEIPVIDLRGEQLANWSEARFLKALAAFRERPGVQTDAAAPAPITPGAPRPGTRRGAATTFTPRADIAGQPAGDGDAAGAAPAANANRWLGEILLAAMPYALFATDLQGNTLFYNGRFEEGILTKRALKNSIRLAESFFLELTRTLLARSFEEDPLRKQRNALTTYHEDLEVRVRIQNLEQDGRIQGYLYIFLEPGTGELFHELAERIGRGQGLEDVMDDVEGRFIYLMLERHGQNVSHTARALKIKRSTLQNKIKRLRIDERYNRRIEGPVRRHRRTVAEILAAREQESRKTAAAPGKKSAKSSVASPARKRTAEKLPATKKKAAKAPAKKSAKPVKRIAKKTAKKTTKKAAKKTAKKVGGKPGTTPATNARKKTGKSPSPKAAKKTKKRTAVKKKSRQ